MQFAQILLFFQIGVAVLLGTAILIQQKGTGLSSAFGGEGGFYRTKRGFEKILLWLTILLAALFIGIGIATIIISPTHSAPSAELETSQPAGLALPEIEVVTEPVSSNSN